MTNEVRRRGAGATATILHDLEAIVGREHVLTDPGVIASYCTDWTGRFVGSCAAVARPGSTDEVAAIVATCRDAGVAIVPQGGNTGLVGGSVPMAGEIVVALTRLTDLDVDAAAAQATLGAGVPIARLQTAAATIGMAYGVDLASRDSATLGGTVATNAGGLHVMRYGDTRAQLVGIEAVLGTGAVVSHLSGLTRDNTGYHLPSLLAGSEGTLGIVTRARVRLVISGSERAVALLGFDSVEDAMAAVAVLRRAPIGIDAVEFMLREGIELVCAVEQLPPPFTAEHAAYVLVEAAGSDDVIELLADVVASIGDGVRDAAVAADAVRRAALWRYREEHTEAINRVGTPHKLDVALPASALAAFIEEVPGRVHERYPSAQCWLFGHAADGNVHVNVTGVDPDDESVDDVVLRVVADYGGSISAEHGIGRAKARWLHLNRTAAEIDAFRAIKGALDPDGIMNPGVLLA
jgi:FAD/FMN-containing dehydrogenase